MLRKSFEIALGFLIIFGGIILLYYLIKKTFSFILDLESDITVSLIAAMSTVIISVLSIVVGKYFERKKVIEQELREKKVPVYEEFIGFFINLLMDEKIKGKPMSEKEMMKFFNDFTKKLIVWGSDDVVKIWSDYRNNYAPKGKENVQKSMLRLEDLLLAIRKDTGHKNKNIHEGDLLGLFINDIKNYTGG